MIIEFIIGSILWFLSYLKIGVPFTTFAMYIFIGLQLIQVIPFIIKHFKSKIYVVKVFAILAGVWLIINAIVVNPFAQLGLTLLLPLYLLLMIFVLSITGLFTINNLLKGVFKI